jgi:hypothetical protein
MYNTFIKENTMKLPKVFWGLAFFVLTFAGCEESGTSSLRQPEPPPRVVAPRSYLVAGGETYYFDELAATATAVVAKLQNNGAETTSISFTNEAIRKDTITAVVLGADLSVRTTVGTYFLYKCTGITSLDLSGLSNVVSIGNHFLYHCDGLTSLDLWGLSKVTTVGDSFLSYCSGLISIDTSPLAKVTTVGELFLNYCTGLTSINLSGLSNLTTPTALSGFLSHCQGLTLVDLSALSKVTSVAKSFLGSCTSLMSVKFPLELEPANISATSFMEGVPAACVLHVPSGKVADYTGRFGRATYTEG